MRPTLSARTLKKMDDETHAIIQDPRLRPTSQGHEDEGMWVFLDHQSSSAHLGRSSGIAHLGRSFSPGMGSSIFARNGH